MTPRHFDLRASESELRKQEFDEFAIALADAKDDETKLLVSAQSRMRDSAILPQLEAMRAVNEGTETDIVIGAVAVNTANGLVGIAEATGRPVEEVVERFAAMLLQTVEALDWLDEDDADGVGTQPLRPFTTQVGNA